MTDIAVSKLQLALRITGKQPKQKSRLVQQVVANLLIFVSLTHCLKHTGMPLRGCRIKLQLLYIFIGWLACNSRALHPVEERSADNAYSLHLSIYDVVDGSVVCTV